MDGMIESITAVGAYRALAPGLLNREVVAPTDQQHSSPFILLVEDTVEPGAVGFGLHPHRGFETVMLQLAGTSAYEDSLGHTGVTRSGDVEWTRAGRGIMHGSHPIGDAPLHSLQLWLNLPASMKAMPPDMTSQPSADAATISADGVRTTVYAGRHGGFSRPHRSQVKLTLIVSDLEADRAIEFVVRGGDRAFVYVVSGEVEVDGAAVVEGHVVWLNRRSDAAAVVMTATYASKLVYYAAPPIDEPVVIGGPFVMNSEEEIRQAYADLRAGRIGR